MADRQQKTYQATKSMQLDTYTLVDGKKVLIEFRGGTIEPRRNGRYTTTDPKIIKSLDDNLLRVKELATYKCIHSDVLLDDDDDPRSPSVKELGNVEARNIPDIKTVTAARSWLIDESEKGTMILNGEVVPALTSSVIKNRTDVLSIAKENKITFTDLPTE